MTIPGHNPLSSEQIFILAALRFLCGSASQDGQEISSLLQKGPLDWGGILFAADRHRVSAFLAYALNQAQLFHSLPVPVQGVLKSAAERAAMENLAKMMEFKKYSTLFAEQNISVIPLKGIALTHTVYGEMLVRRMGDIDILVREGDLGKIKELLEAHGFYEKAFANLGHTEIVSRLIGRGSYVKESLDIDLQWRPVFYIGGDYVEWDSKEGWEQALPRPELGGTARLLSPRQQAQYLLFQIANDFDQDYLFLVQLFDLAMVVKKFNLEPAGILKGFSAKIKSAHKLRIEKLLQAVHEIFFEKGDFGALTSDTAEIIQAMFESKLDARAAWSGKGMLPAPVSWRDKIAFFAGYFFPDPEYIRQQYGSGAGAWMRGYGGHWARLMLKALKFLSSGHGQRH